MPSPKKKRRFSKLRFLVGVFLLGILILLGIHLNPKKASADVLAVHSGTSGYCIDVNGQDTAQNAPVDNQPCGGNPAQAWTVTRDTIEHANNMCLTAGGDGMSIGSPIILTTCNGNPTQIWIRDQNGFDNPNSNQCLSEGSSVTSQLVLAACKQPDAAEQNWKPSNINLSPSNPNLCGSGSQGEKIACEAEKEWNIWQSNSPSHPSLMNQYTDGAPYEEWCADFVSYVYKEAGYPFTGGETDGWDENNANNIQNMDFMLHDPASYTPQPGDVAYFSYTGGHVEIVISGGKHPTFIYGDAGDIDPTTNNGQMEANAITYKPTEGQLVYYLSPN